MVEQSGPYAACAWRIRVAKPSSGRGFSLRRLSAWEASESFELDHNSQVEAWVKNDHLGFEVLYVYRGVVRKYRPDFLIRLKSGHHLVLQTKGQDTEQDETKRRFLAEWTEAVNQHGGFGT